MSRRYAAFLWAFAAIVLVSAVSGAGGPSDTGIIVNYGPTQLAMPYNGGNGNALLAAAQTATSSIGNNFNSPIRGDMIANLGGQYNGTAQTGYFSVNGQLQLTTQGQGVNYFGYVGGLGKGNAIWGNGVQNCYGGGEVALPSSTPECVALGEFDSAAGSYVWSATVAGSPSTGATTIQFTSPTNPTYLGARAILNLSHVTGGTGTISAITACQQGSGGVCPGTCPGGTGSTCTVVTFAGSTINTTAGLSWYFKTGYQNDYYSPSCGGDDVILPNAGGVGVQKCLGHWYKVATVNSATKITLYGSFDSTNLGAYLSSANYLLVNGIEATDVSQSANTITIPTNSFNWANGDFIYSPPDQYMVEDGINLIFTKYYTTGNATAPSRGIDMVNYGPNLMDTGIYISGGSSSVGGFRTGIDLEDLNILSSGPSGTVTNNTRAINIGTDVNYVLVAPGGALSPPKNQIALGPSGQAAIYESSVSSESDGGGAAAALALDGVHTNIAVGLFNNGEGFKHQRVSTGSVTANATTNVEVAWPTAFNDTNYTPVCVVYDPDGYLTTLAVTQFAAGYVYVQIKNADVVSSHNGTIFCQAVHD